MGTSQSSCCAKPCDSRHSTLEVEQNFARAQLPGAPGEHYLPDSVYEQEPASYSHVPEKNGKTQNGFSHANVGKTQDGLRSAGSPTRGAPSPPREYIWTQVGVNAIDDDPSIQVGDNVARDIITLLKSDGAWQKLLAGGGVAEKTEGCVPCTKVSGLWNITESKLTGGKKFSYNVTVHDGGRISGQAKLRDTSKWTNTFLGELRGYQLSWLELVDGKEISNVSATLDESGESLEGIGRLADGRAMEFQGTKVPKVFFWTKKGVETFQQIDPPTFEQFGRPKAGDVVTKFVMTAFEHDGIIEGALVSGFWQPAESSETLQKPVPAPQQSKDQSALEQPSASSGCTVC